MTAEPKVALVHDWLVKLGGAEQVLAALLEIWPEAPVYTLVYEADGPCSSFTRGHSVKTSFIQKLPGGEQGYRKYLPLMPLAIEQFDLSEYDIIVSSCHAVAKGVLTSPQQQHIAYLHAPFRYAWGSQSQYLSQAHMQSGLRSWIARITLHYIRIWDLASAARVDRFLANSHYTARNIEKTYHQEAKVIYPPVDVNMFRPDDKRPDDKKPDGNKEGFYLTVSRLVKHKRVDVIVEAFNSMAEKELVVVGEGPEFKRLKSGAGKNIRFLGFQSMAGLLRLMQEARAFLFAAEEDFGIVPVEAQACGTPVIAYGKGGALETVVEGKTGFFFPDQTAESLICAINAFERRGFEADREALSQHARRFSKERFKEEIKDFVSNGGDTRGIDHTKL